MDFLLAGILLSSMDRVSMPVIVQRCCPCCGSPVENIPLHAERYSGRREKLFAFPPEWVFAFRAECCSESQRNGVRFQTGIAFAFDRIPQLDFKAFFIPSSPAPFLRYSTVLAKRDSTSGGCGKPKREVTSGWNCLTGRSLTGDVQHTMVI